jgi:hypothetical protein
MLTLEEPHNVLVAWENDQPQKPKGMVMLGVVIGEKRGRANTRKETNEADRLADTAEVGQGEEWPRTENGGRRRTIKPTYIWWS